MKRHGDLIEEYRTMYGTEHVKEKTGFVPVLCMLLAGILSLYIIARRNN